MVRMNNEPGCRSRQANFPFRGEWIQKIQHADIEVIAFQVRFNARYGMTDVGVPEFYVRFN